MRNLFERKIASNLKRRKVKFSYESEKLSYTLNYIPDFIIEIGDRKIYVEAKGYFRDTDKTKLRAVLKSHPGLDLRILFYSFKRKDVKWAIKNKIPYAIATIPKEWLV